MALNTAGVGSGVGALFVSSFGRLYFPVRGNEGAAQDRRRELGSVAVSPNLFLFVCFRLIQRYTRTRKTGLLCKPSVWRRRSLRELQQCHCSIRLLPFCKRECLDAKHCSCPPDSFYLFCCCALARGLHSLLFVNT